MFQLSARRICTNVSLTKALVVSCAELKTQPHLKPSRSPKTTWMLLPGAELQPSEKRCERTAASAERLL